MNLNYILLGLAFINNNGGKKSEKTQKLEKEK